MWAGTNSTPLLPPPGSDSIFTAGDNVDDPSSMIKSRYLSLHSPKSFSRIDQTGLPRPRTRSGRRLSGKKSASPKSRSSTPKRKKSPLPVIDLTKSSEDDVKEQIENNHSNDANLPTANEDLAAKNYLMDPASSPVIKAIPPSPIKLIPCSSPIKRKKSVAFTDIPDSNVLSSPLGPLVTPKKSILKPILPCQTPLQDPSNTANWSKSSPNNPQFWIQGTIIQLPPNSPDLLQLVRGCVKVLHDLNFDKKFEVYASLNHICKFNSTELLQKLFIHNGSTNSPSKSDTNLIGQIAGFIQRDIQKIEAKLFQDKSPSVSPIKTESSSMHNRGELVVSPSKNDPFSLRIISQALKFLYFILSDVELNQFLSIDSVTWFYHHSCEMVVRPEVTKTLLLPYLSIIKDVSVIGRKKKAVFHDEITPLLEKMLFALLNMKSMSSSSLILEKFLTLRNLVTTFPIMMANHLNQWFGVLIVNLCDLTSPMYSKVIAVGISVLLEVAKTYLGNKNVLFSIRQFMKLPIPSQVKSFSSDHKIPSSSNKVQLPPAVNYVVNSLNALMANNQYKFALDIWLGLTLLCNNTDHGFERWALLPQWLNVHKSCINSGDSVAIKIAIANWRGIIYNICINDLCDLKKYFENAPTFNLASPGGPITSKKSQQEVTNVTRPKIRLLLHVLLSTENFQDQHEIIDLLHNVFLSIIYTLLNPLNTRNALKYTHFYWDRIVEEVFRLFYFKKNFSNAYMNELGISLLSRWLKGTTSVLTYNDLRCLSIEPVGLNEINCLPPRWVHSRFERILNISARVLELETVTIDSKLGIINSFLNNIKLTTKKETTPSHETLDIIDNLPAVLEVFYAHNQPSYSIIHTLLINFIDTFTGASLLNNIDNGSIMNIYELILQHATKNFDPNEISQLLIQIFNSVGEKNQFVLLSQVYNLKSDYKKPILEKFVVDRVNATKINSSSNSELILASQMFRRLDNGYSIVAKKLFQDLVLLKEEEFSRRTGILEISHWTFPLFRYFISSVHGSPFSHLDKLIIKLLAMRMNDNNEYWLILQFLVELNYDLELEALSSAILSRYADFDSIQKTTFNEVWGSYLHNVCKREKFEIYDKLLKDSDVVGYDVKPYIKNLWEKLPLLKESWKSRNQLLYWEIPPEIREFDQTVIQVDSEAVPAPESMPEPVPEPEIAKDAEESQSIDTAQDTEDGPVDGLRENSSSEVPDLFKAPLETARKRKSRKSKTPEPAGNKVKQLKRLDFDIHSFTSILDAKLNAWTAKSPQIEQRAQEHSEANSKEDDIAKEKGQRETLSEAAESTKILAQEHEEVGTQAPGCDVFPVDDKEEINEVDDTKENSEEKEKDEEMNKSPEEPKEAENSDRPASCLTRKEIDNLDALTANEADNVVLAVEEPDNVVAATAFNNISPELAVSPAKSSDVVATHTPPPVEIIDVDNDDYISTPTRTRSKRSIRRRRSKRSCSIRSESEDLTDSRSESESVHGPQPQSLRKRTRNKANSPNKKRKSPLKQISMSQEDSYPSKSDTPEEVSSSCLLSVRDPLLQLQPPNQPEFAAKEPAANRAHRLYSVVRGVSADEIGRMTVLERHNLETELIKLMLKLKTSTAAPSAEE